MFDYVIIGSGIVGCSIAKELSRYEVSVLVLEKENDVANGQTLANSAIIHSGHDPKEGTLKAKLCVRGNQLYDDLEKELSISLLRTGAFVVAHHGEEVKMLEMLYQRGLANQVPNMEMLDSKEAFRLEPHLSSTIVQVLSLPSTKVTYPWEVALRQLECAMNNGVQFQKNSRVTSITKINDYYELIINDTKKINSKSIISAAGIFSDQIAHMIEKNVLYDIKPRKGEYFVLDRQVKGFINHVIYPLPNEKGKGVLIVPQVHGNILLGPTSAVQNEKDLASNTKDGMQQIMEDTKKLANQIPFNQIIRSFAGIRASSTDEDFFIQESKEHANFFHVAGIDSPGLTAAPAIAEYLVNEIINRPLLNKTHFNPFLDKRKSFYSLKDEERQKLYREDSTYGNLVCKCEKITEKEIIDAIHGPLGNDTYKGIKKRTRAGSGLCQGGYCEVLILKIIARETNQKLQDINYYGLNTQILLQETKVKK